MNDMTVRDFSKRGDAIPVPDLVRVQAASYERFLQFEKGFDKRDPHVGLEGLMRSHGGIARLYNLFDEYGQH